MDDTQIITNKKKPPISLPLPHLLVGFYLSEIQQSLWFTKEMVTG